MQGTRSIALWILTAVGIGLIGYGGYQWYTFEGLGPGGEKLAVELAYQADVAKMRSQMGEDFEPSDEWERNRRKAIREKVEKQDSQGERGKSWLIAGVALLIFSLGRMFALPLSRRASERDDKHDESNH